MTDCVARGMLLSTGRWAEGKAAAGATVPFTVSAAASTDEGNGGGGACIEVAGGEATGLAAAGGETTVTASRAAGAEGTEAGGL